MLSWHRQSFQPLTTSCCHLVYCKTLPLGTAMLLLRRHGVTIPAVPLSYYFRFYIRRRDTCAQYLLLLSLLQNRHTYCLLCSCPFLHICTSFIVCSPKARLTALLCTFAPPTQSERIRRVFPTDELVHSRLQCFSIRWLDRPVDFG